MIPITAHQKTVIIVHVGTNAIERLNPGHVSNLNGLFYKIREANHTIQMYSAIFPRPDLLKAMNQKVKTTNLEIGKNVLG